MTTTPIDAMGDIKVWLINHATLAPLHDGNVFFRIPDTDPTGQFMRIYRTGGSPQAGDTPLWDIKVSVEAWGTRNQDYDLVRGLATAIEGILFDVQSPILANPEGNTVILDAEANSGFDSPDPDTGWPRIVVNATFTVRHI